jgi:hypothetical protein
MKKALLFGGAFLFYPVRLARILPVSPPIKNAVILPLLSITPT